ncbi:tRNA pseudouridine synthase a [Heliomicrobium modesticaldum Ice1]|uniref:tRNA pseudouridine synthase A n=1 Tax=Heliobacterium modesticaldum (strain ATCC 51547 / Ice1) TaxID=498761 RepID=B0TC90_HELMI|nr:tRNA pseudouridine(38-40) synthase TruA [Heliomicrobium modesticaldum]ABZ83989.1 tRNA pseudouridine synthase a [Heliomicrobium modesticaldum Ice1]
MSERRLKLTVAYDGTCYHGFQTQENPALPTIQDALVRAIKVLTGEEVKVNCAGRTDAGVHARGQVVDFVTSSPIPDDRFPFAMNAILPPDVAVVAAKTVPLAFHSRFGALGKHYRYTIYNHRIPSPFHRRYSHQVFPPLQFEAMAAAAQCFVGTHDFRGFCATGSPVKDFVRTVYRCDLTRQEEHRLVLDVMGNGFLYNMIRIIAGTLIDVGKGKIALEEIPAIIASRDRTRAGMTAPPQGLCLMKVWHDPLDFPFNVK